MVIIHSRLFYAVLLCIILKLTFFSEANAGAWTQAKGNSQHIISYRYYTTDRFFDVDGELTDKRGRFTKHEVNYYNEYGLYNDPNSR